MSHPKSEKTILLEQERAIRKERRELKRVEKEARRVVRETAQKARESYDAKNGGDYTMKRIEPVIRHDVLCSICGDIKSWGQFMPGDPPVCCDCAAIKPGRATPAEPGTTAVGQAGQFALFES